MHFIFLFTRCQLCTLMFVVGVVVYQLMMMMMTIDDACFSGRHGKSPGLSVFSH